MLPKRVWFRKKWHFLVLVVVHKEFLINAKSNYLLRYAPWRTQLNVFIASSLLRIMHMKEVLRNKACHTQNAYRKPSPLSGVPTGIVCPHCPIWVIVLPRHLIGRRRWLAGAMALMVGYVWGEGQRLKSRNQWVEHELWTICKLSARFRRLCS